MIYIFVLDSDIGEETSTSDSGGGGHGLNGSTLKTNKKPRKARTAFTDQQLNCLEKSFERQKYLSVQDRMELAARLESIRYTSENLVSKSKVNHFMIYIIYSINKFRFFFLLEQNGNDKQQLV